MCNELWAICYSKIKLLRFWSEWDLDTVLDKGNELYTSLGYENEYLTFADLPDQLNVEEKIMDISKSVSHIAELSHGSSSFLRISPQYDSGMIIACGFGTSFFSDDGTVYIFDSHSRDRNGLCDPVGTSILLKFDCVVDAED